MCLCLTQHIPVVLLTKGKENKENKITCTLLRINKKIQRTVIFADFKKANVNFYLSGLSFFKTNNFLMKHKKTWNNEKLHT